MDSISSAQLDAIRECNQQALAALLNRCSNVEELCQQTLVLAAPHGLEQPVDLPGAAQALLTLGRFALSRSEYGRALDCFHKSLALYEQAHLAAEMALCRSYVGAVFIDLGDYPHAAEILRQAQSEANSAAAGEGNAALQAEILNNLSYTYVLAGEPDLALESLSSCLKTFRDLHDDMRLSWALDTLGQAYSLKGRLEDALACIMGAMELSIRNGVWMDVVRFKQSAGEIYRAMGDTYRALIMFTDELELAGRYDLPGNQCSALFSTAELYLAEGRAADALPLLEEARPIAQTTGIRQHLRQCCLLLSQAYKQQGNYALALAYHERFYRIDKEIYNAEADQRLRNVQVLCQLDAAREEAELFQLRVQTLQHEVEERRRAEVVLKHMASTDPLTDVLNRRAFFESAEKALADCLENGLALSVILIDLDHFKEVNDQYGHLVGDQALSIVATRLRSHLRGGDFIARYGGEEFIVLLIGVNPAFALLTAERLRRSIANEPISARGVEVPITLSLGVAGIEAGDLPYTLDQLIARADQALYWAKKSGRNAAHTLDHPENLPDLS